MPDEGVLRVEAVVVLVREEEELARDALALQRRERRYRLGPVWKSKFYGAFVLNFASSSTPSTRRLLDSVAVPSRHRSTEPARPRHRREMT